MISRRELLVLALATEGGLFATAWLLGWYLDQPPGNGNFLGFSSQTPLRALAITLPLLAGFLLLYYFPVGPLRKIDAFAEQVVRPVFSRCSLFELILICAAAGIGEEFFFRGFLQQTLKAQFGPWPALAIASVAFGLVHFITLTYAVLAAMAGAYLGYWADQWGSLWEVAIAHAFYDLAALLWLTRMPRRKPARLVADSNLGECPDRL